MTRSEATQAALAAWRDAECQVADTTAGEAASIGEAIVRPRSEYHRPASVRMLEDIERLGDVERRRSAAVAFQPGRGTHDTAADIREAGRQSGPDTPRTATGRATHD